MLNPITFRVDLESGPVDVTATGLDYTAYEDTFDRAALTDLAADRYKAYVYIVWHALHRQGLTTLDFPAFADTTPQFGAAPESSEVPPLGEAPRTGQ